MRSLSPILAALALMGLTFASAAPEAIRVARASWQPGDLVHDTHRTNSALHTVILSEGKVVDEFDSIEERLATKTVRVLEVDARGVSRLRVEYGTLEAVQQRISTPDGGAGGVDEVSERNPLQDRAFVLVREERAFRVLDEEGKRVPDGLACLVLEEEGVRNGEWLPPGARVARELAGRALPLGVDVTLSPSAAQAFVESRDGLENASFVVTPRRVEDLDGVAIQVFSARLTVSDTTSAQASATTIELTGEIRLEAASGRFLDLRLEGTVALDSTTRDDARAIEVSGQGPWTIHASARYERGG